MLAFNSPTDRMMARVAIGIFTLGLVFGLYAVGPPLYWRFYATVIHPFEDPDAAPLKVDPFEDMLRKGGSAGGDKDKVPVKVVSSPPPKWDPNAQYALTRELVESRSQDGYIMVTWANEHYLDFAITWVANLKRAGITGYIVGAMDDDMLKSLIERGIHTWRMNTGITKQDLGWGSANFHKMGRSKINLIKTFLEITSLTVVISDIDTAWVRNPIPFFNRYPEADILTSTDQLGPTVKTEDLEKWPEAGSAFNIGIMLFKPNSKAFVEDWIKLLDKPDMWDQNAFNDLIRKPGSRGDAKHLWKGYNGNLTVGILPCSQFASGHVFFVQRKYEEYGLKPYVGHATFQYSGTPGKRQRFREFMLFEDPPEYYDHPKGFIRLNVNIPKELLDAADGRSVTGQMTAEKLVTHFTLVHHQLLYIRAGLALATLTGRALILPPIMCELDKYWAPLMDGNIPGSHFKKPYICPMDHILDIEGGWHPKKPESEFGPQVEWREYSFLDNPRMNAGVKASRMSVEICSKPEGTCNDGSTPAVPKDNKVLLAPGLDSTKLQTALAATTNSKILEVTNALQMWPAFQENSGWFTDTKQHERFVRRLKHMTSVACCLQTQPGWIWYDFLWDVPHKDRHNRPFDKWHIKLGDQDKRASRALLGVTSDSRLGGRRGLSGVQQQTPAEQPKFLVMMENAAMRSFP